MSRIGRSLFLLALAVLAARIAAVHGLLLVSLTQLISELSPGEIERRTAYEIVITYSVAAFAVECLSGLVLFLEAIGKRSRNVLVTLLVSGGLVYGSHLAFFYLFEISNQVLRQFAQSVAWTSEVGLAVLVGIGALVIWDMIYPRMNSRVGS